jgi:hypothetical protein
LYLLIILRSKGVGAEALFYPGKVGQKLRRKLTRPTRILRIHIVSEGEGMVRSLHRHFLDSIGRSGEGNQIYRYGVAVAKVTIAPPAGTYRIGYEAPIGYPH